MLNKLGTLEKQVLSVVITFIIYSLLAGWQVSALLVIAIGFHECSHLLAAKILKLKTRGFYLLPFIGGISFVAERYKRLTQQAFVVLAGPVGGGVLAFFTFFLYIMTGIPFLGYSAYLMGALNLFNLLPLSMMDGGQLMNTISYSINRKLGFRLQVISSVLAVILLAIFINPILALFIAFLGYGPLKTEYLNQKNNITTNQAAVMNSSQMFLTGGGWILTATSLIWLLHQLKSFSIF
jgi:Zn-dependent protease